jgi:hypothetical protein
VKKSFGAKKSSLAKRVEQFERTHCSCAKRSFLEEERSALEEERSVLEEERRVLEKKSA